MLQDIYRNMRELIRGILNNDIKQVERLLKEGAIDCDTSFDIGHMEHAVNLCVRHNNHEMLKLLLNYGSNVNRSNKDGLSPLHLACFNGFTSVAGLLIKSWANPNAMTSNGDTPLHFAVLHGTVEIVEDLINHGADVNKQNINGQTPLLLATSMNRPHIFRCLLNRRADPTVIDCKSNSAFHYIFKCDFPSKDIIQDLCLTAPCIIGEQDDLGNTVFHLALTYSAWGSNKHDANYRFSKDIHDIFELLIQALPTNRKEKLKILNKRNVCGRTALRIAIDERDYGATKQLILEGCSTEIRDCFMISPLDCAVKRNLFSHSLLLLSAGAKCSYLIKDNGELCFHTEPSIREMVLKYSQTPLSLSQLCRKTLITDTKISLTHLGDIVPDRIYDFLRFKRFQL